MTSALLSVHSGSSWGSSGFNSQEGGCVGLGDMCESFITDCNESVSHIGSFFSDFDKDDIGFIEDTLG
jgi:hypothetical protein